MRFNSPDSLSPFGNGGLNSYAYCAGDPTNKSDPTGHFSLVLRVRSMALRWLKTSRKNSPTNYALMPVRTANLPIPHSKTNGLLSQIENTSTKKLLPEAKVPPTQRPTRATVVTEAPTTTNTNEQIADRFMIHSLFSAAIQPINPQTAAHSARMLTPTLSNEGFLRQRAISRTNLIAHLDTTNTQTSLRTPTSSTIRRAN
jgi:hypothetical protein